MKHITINFQAENISYSKKKKKKKISMINIFYRKGQKCLACITLGSVFTGNQIFHTEIWLYGNGYKIMNMTNVERP
jgi:hypothetical protein